MLEIFDIELNETFVDYFTFLYAENRYSYFLGRLKQQFQSISFNHLPSLKFNFNTNYKILNLIAYLCKMFGLNSFQQTSQKLELYYWFRFIF